MAFGSGAVDLAAAMGQAFSIQAFFIPVVKKAPNPSRYSLYVLIAYIAGTLAYYYIAYSGSVGKNKDIKQYGIDTFSGRVLTIRIRFRTIFLQENGRLISLRPSISSTCTVYSLNFYSLASTSRSMQEESF